MGSGGTLDGNELATGVRPGDVIAGKYRVDRVLGVGGMGVVVAAHHVQLDERCALKFLLPHALGDAQAVARFVREARAAVKIKNEHVARVTDVGTLETGSPYMVMEYLDGRDLGAWVEQRGALPVPMAVDFTLQACEALADAHALGIVHRDLKPANLFCIERSDGEPLIKVLDFGISKVSGPGDASHGMTRTTAFLGSPLYMSPEQMRSARDADARSDLWSLGIVMFELLTGKVPFSAETPTELVLKVAGETAPLARTFRGDIPPGLERVIATCLQREVTKRYQSVAELALALREFAPERARASVDRVVGTMRRAGMPSTLSQSGEVPAPQSVAVAANAATAAAWGQSTAVGGQGRMVALGVGVAALVILGVAVAALKLGGSAMPTTSLAATSASSRAPASSPSEPEPTPPLGVAAPPSTASANTVASAIPSAAATVTASAGEPASSAPQASPKPRPPPVPGEATTSAKPREAKPSCDSPTFVDDKGIRRYKPECLK